MSTNITHAVNTVGIYPFAFASYPAQFFPDFIATISGWKYTLDSYLNTGGRIATIRHMSNLRVGLNPMKYHMNPRTVRSPLKYGHVASVNMDEDTMEKDYLKAMNWDLTTTKPSTKKMQDFGLSRLANNVQAYIV